MAKVKKNDVNLVIKAHNNSSPFSVFHRGNRDFRSLLEYSDYLSCQFFKGAKKEHVMKMKILFFLRKTLKNREFVMKT